MYESLTNSLFRWIRDWDIELDHKNRQIALTLDNFTGHKILYQPKNITLVYFEPGLTSHIQPLDAGIIRCFKAHYRRQFCVRAIQQDDAEEDDIYKINLLDAMTMAKRAWENVSPATIKNCWDHTDIQRPRLPKITLRRPRPQMPTNLAAGWDIVVRFATDMWSIPHVHTLLHERLGDRYIASEWNEPLDVISGAEGDVDAALAAVHAWRNRWAPDSAPDLPDSASDLPDSASDLCEMATMAIPDEHQEVEVELLDLVAQLKVRRRINGEPLTLEELLDPSEEREIGQCLDVAHGGDMEIVSMVRAKARGEIEEIVDSDSDEDDPKVVPPSLKEMIAACRMLEENVLLVCNGALDTVEAVRQFRGHLQKLSREGEKQTTLDMFLTHK